VCVVLRINRIYTTPGERERKREKPLAALYRYKKGVVAVVGARKNGDLKLYSKRTG
jgi:hypothetical protein